MKPISLYIHIPFCKKKCFYCDFVSFADSEAVFENYILALQEELKQKAPDFSEYEIQTIFVGGGTPTILSEKLLGSIMDTVYAKYKVAKDAEISVESNPGTLNKKKLLGLKAMEFNRLSIGLQAWQNPLLQSLGRIHTKEEFVYNFAQARDVGFKNINIDLMFALPKQTLLDWEETLCKVSALKPEHISCYSLIIEEGTPFYTLFEKGVLKPTDDVLDRKMYTLAKEVLNSEGYERYEISNFAKKGKQCRHNLVYWHDQTYIGAGLGAHSYLENKRFHNTCDLKKYLETKGNYKFLIEDIEQLSIETQCAEYMFMGLRLSEGIKIKDFYKRFGKTLNDVYGQELEKLLSENLLEKRKESYSLTERGIDVSNVVFSRFLKE